MPKKNWLFTINNPTDKDLIDEVIVETFFQYLVMGKEVGEQGTPHIQGFAIMKEPTKMSSMKCVLPRAHFEPAEKSEWSNMLYCKKGSQSKAEWEELHEKGPNYGKDADVYEKGEVPTYRAKGSKKGGASTKRKWDDIKSAAKANELDSIEPEIFIKHYHSLKQIAKDYQKKMDDLGNVCGVWYYGPPNTGKSHKARELAGESWYDKPCNKWWDGYQGEKVVIIDDFDKNHKVLGHHLKRWADRYSFPAEMKGSTFQIRPEVIIVTSNYSIEDIFEDDPDLAAAIRRRFDVTHFHEEKWWKRAMKKPRVEVLPPVTIVPDTQLKSSSDSYESSIDEIIIRSLDESSSDLF